MMTSRPTLTTVSVVDALRAALRERILDGTWPPGSPVAEVDVARTFNVSRPSANSAIRALVFEGLLRQEANQRARVATPTADDVADLFLVRIPLELVAIGRVGALADAERHEVIRRARDAVRDLRSVPPEAPHSRFVRADLSFHEVLVDAAGSPRLRRIYTGLQSEIHLCMVYTRQALGRERIAREHAGILQPLQSGDTATAQQAMRDHLEGARDALLKAIAGQDERRG